ncbi:MAG TPA: linear amide C-N hydrolase [Thermoanaerobaculia bacterium]|nr:linear amide C-N hydrolase [Thermoanaerobaculia bacterium]
MTRRWMAGAVALLLGAVPGLACTTFVLRDGGTVLFGKNYDWSLGDGLLVVNPRGLERTALVGPGVRAAAWTSRYGSVTFNQYGVASPSGGINEAGLAIELMWLDESRYPQADQRPVVGNLEWIQYQLDRNATVAEVIKSDAEVRIADHAPLHYLVADRGGDVAVVEFLDGRMVARRGKDVPVPALANDPYDDELLSWQRGDRSMSRFSRAGRRALDFHASGERARSLDYAFATLRSVAQDATQWSIVYDLRAGELFFRTHGHEGIRKLALGGLDFGCSAGVRAVDLEAPGPDLRASLRPLTSERHRSFLAAVYRKTPFLANTPPDRIDQLATEPLGARCAVPAPAR